MVQCSRNTPSPMENSRAVSDAHRIVGAPGAKSSADRYKSSTLKYKAILAEWGIDPRNMDTSGNRDKDKDAVAAVLRLIMERCGPSEENYEDLSAESTGQAIKSAVVHFWCTHRRTTQYAEGPDGSFSGNPGTAPALQQLLNRLVVKQKRSGKHAVVRAHQQTHEDVRTICRKYFDEQVEQALLKNPDVYYTFLQTAVLNCCQFGTVSRADEMMGLRIESLIYSADAIGSPIGGVLPITKTKKTVTHVVFKRAVHRSFCPLEKLLVWLAILRAHGIVYGPVFVAVMDNKLQPNKPIGHRSYASNLIKICKELGLPNFGEHSARRGGVSY